MRHLTADALAGIAVEPSAAMPEQEQKSLLRFLTCGSVDDGKSTLIGRLLSDTRQIFEDQLAALERDSRRHGTTGEEVDLALLVDGLEAEREQGITIDVAYRFFSTPRRKFIVADTPGHEQYTRNMATGASTSDLAIVLIDARQGVLRQTRRHSIIASLLGIRHIVLAINKIDLVGFDAEVFERIVADYSTFARGLGFASVTPMPISARYGDNVSQRSDNTPWYGGPTLLEHLETVDVEGDAGRSAVPVPGAVCQPPEPRFPRLRRHHRVRHDRRRRRGRGREVRPEVARAPHRDGRRRSDARRRRAGGHAAAGGRGRGIARQHAGRARSRVPTSPTSSPRRSSGSTSRRCCRAVPTSCAPRPISRAPR